jgi:hypothetical protein
LRVGPARIAAKHNASSASQLAGLFSAACGGPALQVTGYATAPKHLGKTRTLVFTDALGSRAAVGAAIDEGMIQVTNGGWFRALDGTTLGRLDVDADGPLLTRGEIRATPTCASTCGTHMSTAKRSSRRAPISTVAPTQIRASARAPSSACAR